VPRAADRAKGRARSAARATSPATIAELLRARAEDAPGAPGFLHWADGDWACWSWAEYHDRAGRAGAGLRAAGIGRGDHIVLLVLEVDVAVTLIFGAWAIGAVPMLVGFPYRLDDVAGFVAGLRSTAQRLDAKALVVSDALAGFAAEHGAPASPASPSAAAPAAPASPASPSAAAPASPASPSAAAPAAPAEPAAPSATPRILRAGELLGDDATGGAWEPVEPSATALIQLTSGSTGHPRGVVLSHASILGHLAAISAALPPGADAREVTWLPLHHDMGLIGGLLYPLFNGFAVNVLSPLLFRSDPYLWLKTMSDVRATCTPAPPSAYAIATRLAGRATQDGLDLSALRCAMVGAEPIAPHVLRDFATAFAPCGLRPEAFFPVYGLAEATVAVTFAQPLGATRFDRVDRRALELEGRALPCDEGPQAIELVGVGRPLPGTELRIVRDDGADAGEREVGEIRVRSASLMDGYLGEPEATAAAFEDGWLTTGDLGYEADGSLFVTGRLKDVIIKGGHNLLPAPIEEIAGSVEGVRAGCVAAVGVPSAQRGTQLVYVVAETKVEDERERTQLSRRVREALRLRGIAVDRVVLVAPGSIPRTTSGKVRRREVARTLVQGR
jgi:acyl-CoA synthetase (AMP-forming)/AMP-acid ligase II